MNVPNYVQERIVDEKGMPTDAFSSFMRNLLQNMQLCLSDEGYWIPSVSSDPDSTAPPNHIAPNGQLGFVQNSFQTDVVNPNTQTVTSGVQEGTIVFDPFETNGGSPNPLGQLKVLLNDGTFHKITNT